MTKTCVNRIGAGFRSGRVSRVESSRVGLIVLPLYLNVPVVGSLAGIPNVSSPC